MNVRIHGRRTLWSATDSAQQPGRLRQLWTGGVRRSSAVDPE
jgi:hypothetical protein